MLKLLLRLKLAWATWQIECDGLSRRWLEGKKTGGIYYYLCIQAKGTDPNGKYMRSFWGNK